MSQTDRPIEQHLQQAQSEPARLYSAKHMVKDSAWIVDWILVDSLLVKQLTKKICRASGHGFASSGEKLPRSAKPVGLFKSCLANAK